MSCIRNEGNFKSKTGTGDIFYRSWTPDGEIKAVIQVAHGMAEHGERYEEFARFLCENGCALFVNDHAGHGKSVRDNKNLGYFGEKDGWKNIVEDIKTMNGIIHGLYPDIPVILYGHSMGSFVARRYVTLYAPSIKAAVFCGTSGPNPAASVAIRIADTIAKCKGSHHRSRFINNLAFGSYNKKYSPVRTAFDWLTRDEYIVDRYILDDYCGYLFTAAGYRDMFTLLSSVSSEAWSNAVPKSLPVLLISGEMDPVGDYGKGVRKVADMLKNSGRDKVTLKLYEDARHEILNETNRADVYSDILAWIKEIIG